MDFHNWKYILVFHTFCHIFLVFFTLDVAFLQEWLYIFMCRNMRILPQSKLLADISCRITDEKIN